MHGRAAGRRALQQQAAEAHRLVAERVPREALAGVGLVALGEEQVERLEHAVEALVEIMGDGQLEAEAGGADPSLGAHQLLGHRVRPREERGRDLLDPEAAHRLEVRAMRPAGESAGWQHRKIIAS